MIIGEITRQIKGGLPCGPKNNTTVVLEAKPTEKRSARRQWPIVLGNYTSYAVSQYRFLGLEVVIGEWQLITEYSVI